MSDEKKTTKTKADAMNPSTYVRGGSRKSDPLTSIKKGKRDDPSSR
jgi:hypothetical protein